MLLQENEDERLSKEEQDLAWDVYRKTINWEEDKEVQRVSPQESNIIKQDKIFGSEHQQMVVAESADNQKPLISGADSPRNRYVQKKCTKLSHQLTLRSQGTKMGCSTICDECAQEISWEDLN